MEKIIKEDKILKEMEEKEEKMKEYITGGKRIEYFDFLDGEIKHKELIDEEDLEHESEVAKELAEIGKKEIKKDKIKIEEFKPIVELFKNIMKEDIEKCYIQNSVLYISEIKEENDLYLRFSGNRMLIQVFFKEKENYKNFLILIDRLKNKYMIRDIEFTMVKDEYFKNLLKEFNYYDMYPNHEIIDHETYTNNKESVDLNYR